MNKVMEQPANKPIQNTNSTFVHYKIDHVKKERLIQEYYKKLFVTMRGGVS